MGIWYKNILIKQMRIKGKIFFIKEQEQMEEYYNYKVKKLSFGKQYSDNCFKQESSTGPKTSGEY